MIHFSCCPFRSRSTGKQGCPSALFSQVSALHKHALLLFILINLAAIANFHLLTWLVVGTTQPQNIFCSCHKTVLLCLFADHKVELGGESSEGASFRAVKNSLLASEVRMEKSLKRMPAVVLCSW